MTRHLLFWFILMVIGILNGVLRVSTYGKWTSDLAAHQVSTLTGIALSGIAVWILWSYWPLESARAVWTVGIVWLCATVVFEFGFGHFIAGHSWRKLMADYNLLKGRVWSLFLLWILIMPYVFFRLTQMKG